MTLTITQIAERWDPILRRTELSAYANKTFWIDTFDRSASTFAQATLAVLTADATGILNIDWPQVLSVGSLAATAQTIAFRGKTNEVRR